MKIRLLLAGIALQLSAFLAAPAYASSAGSEGAAFLEIPVGAGPAALGSAYTALAADVYASVYNPAGLGTLASTQLTGQHLSYLDSLNYEFVGAAVRLPQSWGALGGSVQYLGTGDSQGRDESGNPTSEFSDYYTAYNLAYGRQFGSQLSLGLTGKLIRAKLDDVSASAFAADLGTMYRLNNQLNLAATVTNLGSKLTFIDQGDSLPLAFHLGAAYQPTPRWLLSGEAAHDKTGLTSLNLGGQWTPMPFLSLRLGYRTDVIKEQAGLAGLSAGFGVDFWGQELAYAWVPYGDLGDTHYISLLLRFGESTDPRTQEVRHLSIDRHGQSPHETTDNDQLMQLLNEYDNKRLAQNDSGELLP
jgi:hypothetical protein